MFYFWRNSPLVGHVHRSTQHSQQTDIHAPRGIQTNNLIRRAAADLRLEIARPLGPAFYMFIHQNTDIKSHTVMF